MSHQTCDHNCILTERKTRRASKSNIKDLKDELEHKNYTISVPDQLGRESELLAGSQ